MSCEIINIEQYGDALRSTGYKNIESAVSEIIDNSIEANAKDVFVIVSDTVSEYSGKKYVTEIAFLDNGIGMDQETLSSCLQIGYGTRRERKGMGRFGVGLPQSSLHAAPRVEVYSWQDGISNCRMTYLDINLVREGKQKSFPEPQIMQLPSKYASYIKYRYDNKQFDFSQTGTLVIWENCDNVSPKTVKPLFDRLEFELGKKFRHLIGQGTHDIYLLHSQNDGLNRKVMPNDPLFLMKPNLVLGNITAPGNIIERDNTFFTETLFEPFVVNEIYPDGIMPVTVEYRVRETKEKKKSIVTLRFSVVRREFYDISAIPGDPGGTKMGKHVKKLEGISVIRAGREIDFGQFDYYSNLNQPEHRWWGCEISFEPELDEAFGVSNNKQHVELIRLDESEYEDEDDVKPIWIQLRKQIYDTISAMYKRNKTIRKSARTVEAEVSPAERIINEAEAGSTINSASKQEREVLTDDELLEQAINSLTSQNGKEPTNEMVNAYLSNRVNFIYKSNGKSHFFDYEFKGMGTLTCIINTDHIFYENFMKKLENDVDFKTAFELFLASLVITIDEATQKDRDSFDELVTTWNEKLRKYIKTQLDGSN